MAVAIFMYTYLAEWVPYLVKCPHEFNSDQLVAASEKTVLAFVIFAT